MDFTNEQLRALVFPRNSAQFRTLPRNMTTVAFPHCCAQFRAMKCRLKTLVKITLTLRYL